MLWIPKSQYLCFLGKKRTHEETQGCSFRLPGQPHHLWTPFRYWAPSSNLGWSFLLYMECGVDTGDEAPNAGTHSHHLVDSRSYQQLKAPIAGAHCSLERIPSGTRGVRIQTQSPLLLSRACDPDLACLLTLWTQRSNHRQCSKAHPISLTRPAGPLSSQILQKCCTVSEHSA